jgi:hypothetical protein
MQNKCSGVKLIEDVLTMYVASPPIHETRHKLTSNVEWKVLANKAIHINMDSFSVHDSV